MGWASAGDIFDPVAQALVDLNAPAALKRRVLGTLIDKLRDGDWDTEDESLEIFRHDEEAHDGDGQVLARYLIGGEQA